MLNSFDNFEPPEESDQVKALRRLACMYHAAGNYDKAEELMKIAEQWHHLNRSRRDGHRPGHGHGHGHGQTGRDAAA